MGAYHLIVHNPFGSYRKGAHIRDDAEVARVLAGSSHRNVLRIAPVGDVAPAAPAPAAPAPAAPAPAEATPVQGAHA